MPFRASIDDPPRVLAPYVRIGVQDSTLFLGFGSIRRPVHDRTLWEPLLRLADHFHEPRTRFEAWAYLRDSHGVDAATTEAVMLLLEDGNCLIPTHAYNRADRYSRHALFYELSGADSERVRHRLADSRVLLLGCGGIGSLVAVTLATAGVGELILVVAPEARGKGVGTVATRLTLDYAFQVIGLDMVWLKVLEPNTAGRNAYAKAGFREVGTMRSAGVWKGHRCGEVVMDAVPEDFPWPSVIVEMDG